VIEAPPGFAVRAVPVDAGCERVYDEAEWRDAIVVVARGEIELECIGGDCARFDCGSVLWFVGLPLRVLRAHGAEPALLVAVSRRGDESSAGARSNPKADS
jgi:hypothetical protein